MGSNDKETAALHLQIGTEELQNGAYPQALTTLLKAESLDPDSAPIQNNLGLAYYVREKYQEAESHIKKAIEIDPKYSDAHNNLGRVYLETGRYEDAIRELKLVENDLTYVNPEKAYLNLAIVYFRKKSFPESIEYLNKTLNIQRDNCVARNYLGRNYYEQKQYGRASEELDRAVSFCKRALFDEPSYYSALSYYSLGRQDKAEARLEEMIKLFPNGQYYEKAKSMLDIMKR